MWPWRHEWSQQGQVVWDWQWEKRFLWEGSRTEPHPRLSQGGVKSVDQKVSYWDLELQLCGFGMPSCNIPAVLAFLVYLIPQ